MNITEEKNLIAFAELDPGTIFSLPKAEDEYYIKTFRNIDIGDGKILFVDAANACQLHTGELVMIDFREKVILPCVKLVVLR